MDLSYIRLLGSPEDFFINIQAHLRPIKLVALWWEPE